MRYLFPLLVMGILLAYFYKAAIWKRLALVLSTIPLTIVTNSLRIAVTGIIYTHWGAAAAEGFFHGFSGWLIFIFTLGVLLGEIWLLRKIIPHPSESFFGKSGSSHGLVKALTQPGDEGLKAFLAPPQYAAAIALLILSLGVSLGVEFREKVPTSNPLSQFPQAFSEWSGSRQYLGQEFLKDLDLSDYTIIDFRNKKDQAVNFYVAYYESQRKGESIHSPDSCLPASGWEFYQAGQVKIPLEGKKAILINRAIIEKGGSRQMAYYWFPMRGRILTNAWEMKIYTFWDALTKQRTDGALVRVITPVLENERVEDAEARLQGFTREITPILSGFIPD